MVRFVSLLVLPGLLACSQQLAPLPASAAKSPAVAGLEEEVPELTGESGPLLVRAEPRRVGDLFVHRFELPKRATPLVLREEVIGQEGELLVVDFELTEGSESERLRVRLSARSERVVSVMRLGAGEPEPGTIAEYEKMMAKTSFAPDENAGESGRVAETCLVGGEEHSCDVVSYRVFVKDAPATLVVAHSEELGRDISGELVTEEGKVLYRAELVEQRRGPAVVGAVALQAMTDVPVRARTVRDN